MVDAQGISLDESDIGNLPLFANNEAKTIHKQIALKQAILENAFKEYDENVDRIRVMEEHLKNVRQEVTRTTSLLNAKKSEIQSENHGTELAKREAGRYEQEVRREQTELEQQEELLNNLQNQASVTLFLFAS